MTTTGLRTAAVGAALLAVVLVGGCRAGDPPPAGRAASGVPAPGASTADPLGDIDATLDAIERDLDADAATG